MSSHLFPAGLYPILDLDACQNANRRPEDLALNWAARAWMPYQLRAKTLDASGYAALAERLHSARSRLPGPHHPRIIANDFLEVAWHHSHWFCGIHLGQHDLHELRPRDAEMLHQIRQSGGVCGCSTHNADQFLAAFNEMRGGLHRWSYVALGPVFPTRSKTNSTDQNEVLNIEETLRILQKASSSKSDSPGNAEDLPTIVLIGSMDAGRWMALQEAWRKTRDSRALRLSVVPAAIASVHSEDGCQAWTECLIKDAEGPGFRQSKASRVHEESSPSVPS
ncbi:MAG: thiamine phosphate synthase [Leptospiraceae bacterium]|nr:thiamine phosphate synthase [Leptospiraceae bacterium]